MWRCVKICRQEDKRDYKLGVFLGEKIWREKSWVARWCPHKTAERLDGGLVEEQGVEPWV